ncbi:MAG: GNAT family N-acetyltransferase [Syntrophobacteraceae bacterium]|nr:GNAT family N-acetyltransferase [Syntrophobacteraceae bacterium]
MQVAVIRDFDSLASLREAWNLAVEASHNDSVFLTHEWFYSWAKAFSSPDELYVLVAYDHGRVLGIMPLKIERARRGMWTGTVLKSMSNPHTCKYDIIVHRERRVDVLAAMFRYIGEHIPWAVMELNYVPVSSPSVDLLRGFQGSGFYRMRILPWMESPYVAIEGSWDSYFSGRDKRVRKNWQNFERRANREGSSEVVSIHGGKDLEKGVRAAFEIEKTSWKGAVGSAMAMSDAISGFYLDLAERMSCHGRFQLHFLNFNGQKIAFDYCLKYKDHFNVLKTGYNPAFSVHSPGRVLHVKVLRSLYDQGTFKKCDLLGTRDVWKEEFTNLAEPLIQVRLYNRRFDAMLAYGVLRFLERTKKKLRQYPQIYKSAKSVYIGLKHAR